MNNNIQEANREGVPRYHHLLEFEELKFDHMLSILQDIRDIEGRIVRVVVLTRKDLTARFLAARMRNHQINASAVYGSRKLRRKRAASSRFNSGRYEVLFVSKSGMDTDTQDIFHFINYDLPLPYPLNLGGMIIKRNRRCA